MTPVIAEPRLRNPLMRLGVAVSERIVGRRLTIARLLAWSPRVAIGAGLLEATTPAPGPGLPERTLKLARLTASLTVNCAFCLDMNASGHRRAGISDEEVYALRDGRASAADGFSPDELLVIAYARGMSATPIDVDDEIRDAMAATFGERRLVELASAIAAVNHWARLAQALDVPPAGFGDHCLAAGQPTGAPRPRQPGDAPHPGRPADPRPGRPEDLPHPGQPGDAPPARQPGERPRPGTEDTS